MNRVANPKPGSCWHIVRPNRHLVGVAALMPWLKLPACKVGDREFIPRSGIQRNTICLTSVVLMLGQRCRRWANIKTTWKVSCLREYTRWRQSDKLRILWIGVSLSDCNSNPWITISRGTIHSRFIVAVTGFSRLRLKPGLEFQILCFVGPWLKPKLGYIPVFLYHCLIGWGP